MNIQLKPKRRPLFCQPYKAVLMDSRLSRDARFLYVILRSFAGSKSHCFPSTEALSAICHSSVRSTQRWIKELEKLRIIKRQHRYENGLQRSNIYILDDEHFASFLAQKPTKSMRQKSTTRGVTKEHHEVDTVKKRAFPAFTVINP